MPGGLRTARHCIFTEKVATENGISLCEKGTPERPQTLRCPEI